MTGSLGDFKDKFEDLVSETKVTKQTKNTKA